MGVIAVHDKAEPGVGRCVLRLDRERLRRCLAGLGIPVLVGQQTNGRLVGEVAGQRKCAPLRMLSNGLSTVETKAGLRGMIADRAERVVHIKFNPCIVSRFVRPRSSTERTRVS